MHTHKHAHAHTQTRTRMHAHRHRRAHTDTHTDTRTDTHAHACTQTHAHTHTQTHTHAHIHRHTRAHTDTHTHGHTHRHARTHKSGAGRRCRWHPFCFSGSQRHRSSALGISPLQTHASSCGVPLKHTLRRRSGYRALLLDAISGRAIGKRGRPCAGRKEQGTAGGSGGRCAWGASGGREEPRRSP